MGTGFRNRFPGNNLRALPGNSLCLRAPGISYSGFSIPTLSMVGAPPTLLWRALTDAVKAFIAIWNIARAAGAAGQGWLGKLSQENALAPSSSPAAGYITGGYYMTRRARRV